MRCTYPVSIDRPARRRLPVLQLPLIALLDPQIGEVLIARGEHIVTLKLVQNAFAAKMQIASTVKLCFMNAPLSSTAGFNLLYQLGARRGNLLSTLQIFQRKRA